MNPLALLPYWKWAVMAGLALALGVQTVRVEQGQTALAQQRAAHAETLANIADLTAKAERAVRAEEGRRAAALERIAHDAQTSIDAARSDAAAADRAAVGLRGQLAAYVARARAASPRAIAAPAGAAAGPEGAALDVLAGLFAGADDAAGGLAKALDASRAAGLACEASYGAISTHQIVQP